MITIRGGTESTRYAVQLINSLIQDPAKELEDLIPRNHIRAPGSKTAASFPNTTGPTGGSTAKPLSSLVTSTGVSFQPVSSMSSSSQASGKIGKGLPSNVRQPFPVSLAYAHPQLAILAAQTMHQIRHPRLPMAQFGGTFSPAASTWGPFPVRPVSPGSANSSPKHNGGSASVASQPRPSLAHGDHSNTSSTGAVVTTTTTTTTSTPNTSTAPASPHTPNPTPYNPQPNTPTPSSVRKQLFGPDPKPQTVNSVSVSAASATNVSNTVRGTGSPAHHNSTAHAANSTPQPVGPISQPPIQPVKTDLSAVATPGKDKPSLATESQTISVSENITSVGFSAPAIAPSSKPESRQQLPTTLSSVPSSEATPPLLNHQPSSNLSSAATAVLSHNIAHPNNTVPHFSAPAPRVSHRMQPPGPYYSLPEQQQPQTQQQQQQSVFVPFNTQEPPKQSQNQTSQPASLPPQAQAPGSLQVSANLGMINGSQMQHVASPGKAQQITNFGPAGLFNFSSIFDNNNQVSNNPVWSHLPARSPPEQSYSAPPNYMAMSQMDNMIPQPPPDNSKAPGFRPSAQRIVNSPIAYTTNPVYLHGHTAVGGPSFSRQHFSPHPWSATSGDAPVPPPATVSSSALSTSAVAPPPPQPKPGSTSQQDRKVPPPIGTERLARIRQTGSVNAPLLTTNYTASVGQGGIWSFGVGSASEAMSGWSQPLMNSHMMHPQLQAEQSAFSQHQPMEQDDTGIANPANNFHQPQHMPNSYIPDFPKGIPISMYGGTMLPPHPTMAEGPGGAMYNGLHTGDPAWSPIIKVVPNNADNSDPQQQVWPGTWAPHLGNVHLNHVN